MTIFEIHVYYDTICAWCYIGHRTLFQAINLFQRTYPDARADEFAVTWLPFYRDRNLPSESVPLQQRLVSVFGEERTANEVARVQRIGRTHGINFTLQGNIGHTRDAHRLVYLAGVKGGPDLQKALIEQIYFGWFEVGGDITSHTFLRECAVGIGLNEDEVRRLLESSEFADDIDGLDANARHEGISCVPTYSINGAKIEGAADVETFYETFTRLKSGQETSVPASSR